MYGLVYPKYEWINVKCTFFTGHALVNPDIKRNTLYNLTYILYLDIFGSALFYLCILILYSHKNPSEDCRESVKKSLLIYLSRLLQCQLCLSVENVY